MFLINENQTLDFVNKVVFRRLRREPKVSKRDLTLHADYVSQQGDACRYPP